MYLYIHIYIYLIWSYEIGTRAWFWACDFPWVWVLVCRGGKGPWKLVGECKLLHVPCGAYYFADPTCCAQVWSQLLWDIYSYHRLIVIRADIHGHGLCFCHTYTFTNANTPTGPFPFDTENAQTIRTNELVAQLALLKWLIIYLLSLNFYLVKSLRYISWKLSPIDFVNIFFLYDFYFINPLFGLIEVLLSKLIFLPIIVRIKMIVLQFRWSVPYEAISISETTKFNKQTKLNSSNCTCFRN